MVFNCPRDRCGFSIIILLLSYPIGTCIYLNKVSSIYFIFGTFIHTYYPVFPPRITSPPVTHQKVKEGEQISLRVTAEGTKPLTYQWIKDGQKLEDDVNCSGLSTNCLSIKQAYSKFMGEYRCTVSNQVGKDTSIPTCLTIGGYCLVMYVSYLCILLTKRPKIEVSLVLLRLRTSTLDSFKLYCHMWSKYM